MKNQPAHDAALRQRLRTAAEHISADNLSFADIRPQLTTTSPRKERFTMKKIHRYALAAICCLSLVGTSAYAVGHLNAWQSSSSAQATYESLPSAAQVADDVGFTPKFVASFENGYQFNDGTIGKSQALDENGNVLGKVNDIHFSYLNADGQEALLSVREILPGGEDTETDYDEKATIDGVPVYLNQTTHKTVPNDYTPTADDQAQIAAGTLTLSYGSDTIVTGQVRSVTWNDSGLRYCLLLMDNNTITTDDTLAMANAIINAK